MAVADDEQVGPCLRIDGEGDGTAGAAGAGDRQQQGRDCKEEFQAARRRHDGWPGRQPARQVSTGRISGGWPLPDFSVCR